MGMTKRLLSQSCWSTCSLFVTIAGFLCRSGKAPLQNPDCIHKLCKSLLFSKCSTPSQSINSLAQHWLFELIYNKMAAYLTPGIHSYRTLFLTGRNSLENYSSVYITPLFLRLKADFHLFRKKIFIGQVLLHNSPLGLVFLVKLNWYNY